MRDRRLHHLELRARRHQAGGIATLSAVTDEHLLAPPPSGGNCSMRGATRRQHADSQLLMLQNPHRHRHGAHRRGAGGPGWGAGGCRKPGNCTHGRCHGETNFAQQEPRRAASVQNSPSTPPRTACAGQNSPCTPLPTACPVQNSPSTPEMARFGAISTCRESFVPFSPPRSRAGRVLYRSHHQEAKQGEFCTERKAEIELANTTAHQAPPVWRVPKGPERRAPEGPEGTGGLRGAGPDYTPRGP